MCVSTRVNLPTFLSNPSWNTDQRGLRMCETCPLTHVWLHGSQPCLLVFPPYWNTDQRGLNMYGTCPLTHVRVHRSQPCLSLETRTKVFVWNLSANACASSPESTLLTCVLPSWNTDQRAWTWLQVHGRLGSSVTWAFGSDTHKSRSDQIEKCAIWHAQIEKYTKDTHKSRSETDVLRGHAGRADERFFPFVLVQYPFRYAYNNPPFYQ